MDYGLYNNQQFQRIDGPPLFQGSAVGALPYPNAVASAPPYQSGSAPTFQGAAGSPSFQIPPSPAQQIASGNMVMQRQVVDGRTEVVRRGVNPPSSGLSIAPTQISISSDNFVWSLRNRRIGKGKPILATNSQQFLWSCWENLIQHEPFVYTFGVRNVSSNGGYLYVSANSRDKKVSLIEGNPPARTLSLAQDSRLFRREFLHQSGKTVIQHVATRFYITVRIKDSGRHKLMLTPDQEKAYHWNITYA